MNLLILLICDCSTNDGPVSEAIADELMDRIHSEIAWGGSGDGRYRLLADIDSAVSKQKNQFLTGSEVS